MNVAVLVPVCSRNQQYTSQFEVPFLKYFYPSFMNTCDSDIQYTIFLGYDDDDLFYKGMVNTFTGIDKRIKPFELNGCQHSPPSAWNALAKIAYEDPTTHFDYFFQVGDDVVLEKKGWTKAFILKLQEHNNIGIVGPCNMLNYHQRVSRGMKFVIENAFVTRKHMHTFGYLFEPSIRNWYCDDWITRIYDDIFCEIQLDYTCINSVIDTRYTIQMCPDITKKIEEGKKMLGNPSTD